MLTIDNESRTLSQLYDADLGRRDPTVVRLRKMVRIPHPLHGVAYADGVTLCGRQICQPCRDYRKKG